MADRRNRQQTLLARDSGKLDVAAVEAELGVGGERDMAGGH